MERASGGADGYVAWQLLGPVQLRIAGRLVDLGPAKQRTVLAALLVDPGRPLPTETLIDRVWGDDPPASARSALYSYAARLRRILSATADAEPARLAFGAGGYRVTLAERHVDLCRFRQLIDMARDGDYEDEQRAAMLDEALGLWQGPALAGLPGDWVARTREVLNQQRLDAVVSWARIGLRLGRTDTLIGPLRAALSEHPLVEPLAATLMEALRRQGRSAEALDCYGATRRHLTTELGVEPGPELQRLHVAILRQETGARADEPPANTARPLAVPAQLPLGVHGFVGRADAIARLDALLTQAEAEPNAVAVLALCGGAGIGKTALAIHWAHRVAERFPGGQLFVNLRGFDPTGEPLSSAVAVRLLLDGLGVPAERVPVSEAAQVGLYRSLLAGRRILVVLDNAASAEQVRPLLPGSPGCLVVVTSRDPLSGLGTAEAAHPLTLDVLTPAEARDLVVARIGAGRAAAEPAAVSDIVDRCTGLPLALAIVAGRAAAQPERPLAHLADELADGRLDAFGDPDPATDLRAVFSWSYHRLSPEGAQLFRLLGSDPGPDIDPAAAACLAGVSLVRARATLAELTRVHLLTETSVGRFALHDLLRSYARELAHAHDPDEHRRAATRRVLDHYVHTAHAIATLMTPHRDAIALSPAAPDVVVTDGFSNQGQAIAWINARRCVLLAYQKLAAELGWHGHTWQLAWAIGPALDRSGHWRELVDVHELALTATSTLDDLPGLAYTHRILGRAWTRLGDLGAARQHYEDALRVCSAIGDGVGQAHTHLSLGWLYEQRHDLRAALHHVQRAGVLYATAGHRAGQASALNQAGWYHAHLGDHDEALVDLKRALSLHLATGNRYGLASTWDSLGYTHHQVGRHRQAAQCFQRALRLHRDNGDRYREATTLVRSADCHDAAGDAGAACREWTAALAILDSLNHPDADQVRSKLGQPASSARPATAAGAT
jgi:DNA-binding SARP family transcriptional activator/tetratricopeptide (TPR) repeat protein